MRFNSTVALTFTLLVMMLGSGVASGLWSYTIGHAALQGVTQPDVSPTKKLSGDSQGTDAKGKLIIVKENDIINQVNKYIRDSSNQNSQAKQKEGGFIEPSDPGEDSTLEAKPTNPDDKNQAKLPIKAEDQGVILEVVKVSQQGGSLLLDVNLKNDGVKAVRFLYSFLEVKDEKGRSLSAITDGLPGELPANALDFSGTIKIPAALLENAQQLSLTLTDYPDQKLELKMSGIPVVK